MIQDLICTQLILPYVEGDFDEGHLSEAAGGKFFLLEKPNNSVRPVIIGSTWRRAPDSLSVAEVNSDVANFLMFTYEISRSLLAKKMAPLVALKSLCSLPRIGRRMTLITHWLSCNLTS